MKNIFHEERAVSTINSILQMLAVAAVIVIIAGIFTYQSCKPKEIPTMAATLEDDSRVVLTDRIKDGRVARLFIQNIANVTKSDLQAIAVYTGGDATEHTAVLDGQYWAENATPLYGGKYGDSRVQGIQMKWADSDGSGNLTAGDWLDFFEGSVTGGMMEVATGSDFRVKIIHQPTGNLLLNLVANVH